MTDTQFDHLLRPLGIIRTKNDYYTLRQCMTLICTRPDRLRALQKEVYLPVAEASGHAWRAVESAVRRTAKLVWKTDPEKLQVLAGYPLDYRPTAGQFLEMLYNLSLIHISEPTRRSYISYAVFS